MFLINQKDYWTAKQGEVEERFLEMEVEGKCPVQEPKPKKRKRGKGPQPQLSDPYAKYAAELQIQFFTKVNSYICTNLQEL